jgi:hypothetical protein
MDVIREFPLNIAIYRVKITGLSFLYCIPLIWPGQTGLLKK